MKTRSRIVLYTLSLFTGAAALSAATDADLVELLVRRGVITQAEAETLDRSESKAVNPQLLALLVRNGAITQDDAESLQTAVPETAVPSTTADLPDARPVASAEPTFTARAKQKTTQRLTFNGRIHGQGDFLDTSYDAAGDPDHEANLFIRRLYLGVTADLSDSITGVINANFGSGTSGVAEVEKAVVQWDFSSAHSLEAGFRKVPFAFEETTSSAKIKAVERSIATRYFVDQLAYGSRFTGLHLHGSYTSGAYFSTALTNPEQGTVNGSADANTVAGWARVGWEGELGRLPLDIGFSSGRIEDVRAAGVTDWVWGVHAVTQLSDLELTFEYLSGQLENAAAGANATPVGLNLQGAWKVTPQLELVARYSALDADGGIGADISTTLRRAPENGSALFDEAQAYYFGGNWYFRGESLKLSAGYEWASYEDNLTGAQGDATAHGLRTRLQLLY